MFDWWRRLLARAGEGPDEDDGIPLDLAEVLGAFGGAVGLPRPQWDVIRGAADALADRYDPHRVWCEVQRQWIEALAAALGEGCRIVETHSVMLLCAREPEYAASLARLCENTWTTVHGILGEPPERRGKLPVFVFDRVETYYDYIAYFYPDGEHGTTAGLCIREAAAAYTSRRRRARTGWSGRSRTRWSTPGSSPDCPIGLRRAWPR